MANAKRQTKTGRAPKNDGEGLKNDGKGLKNDGGAPEKPGAWWETLSPEEIVARLEQKKDPEPPQVELVAPPRRNRSVDDVSAFVETARLRLRLVDELQEVLAPALPRDPTFLAQLWTARARLVAHGRLAGPDSAQPVLDALLARVMLLRSVVERETRPDDPARKALLFHVTPRATRELPPLAGEILAGAREVRGRFEAMTDGLLAAVESARSEAEAAVSAAQRRERATAAARALTGDQRQLALDLLLHGMDKIANAAVVQLHARAPRLAAALSAPINAREPSAPREPEAPKDPVTPT